MASIRRGGECGSLLRRELELRRPHEAVDLFRVRGACDRRRDAFARDEPGECYLGGLRAVRPGDCIERGEDAQAALVEIFLDAAGAGAALQVRLGAVFAGEKTRSQAVVDDGAD